MITVNGCEECKHWGICKYEDRMKETIDQIALKNLNDGLEVPDFLQVHVRCKWFLQGFRGGYVVDREFPSSEIVLFGDAKVVDC